MGIRLEVVFEWGDEVPDDGHTPGLPQQLLPARAPEVGHVGVVVREAKQPGVREEQLAVSLRYAGMAWRVYSGSFYLYP